MAYFKVGKAYSTASLKTIAFPFSIEVKGDVIFPKLFTNFL
jgi:hypothetical protein